MPEMKSHTEILIEARRLEELGGQYGEERRRAMAGSTTNVRGARILMTFPDSRVTAHGRANSDEGGLDHSVCLRRWIEMGWEEGVVEYRLMEDETESAPGGEIAKEGGAGFVFGSDSAFDALAEGYELIEAERLGELLAPYAERAEAGEIVESIDPALVREVETIIGAGEFAAAARIGAKADIVAFLEGRVDASDFIGAAIARGFRRNCETECIDQRVGERILIDQP